MYNIYSLRYNNVWSDWRATSTNIAGPEQTLDLATGEDITSISGYSGDTYGSIYSLQAKTSAGRQCGPFGDHRANPGYILCSSPPPSSGLRLHHLSGDKSKDNKIIRWLQL